jgi:hypothetical protein
MPDKRDGLLSIKKQKAAKAYVLNALTVNERQDHLILFNNN